MGERPSERGMILRSAGGGDPAAMSPVPAIAGVAGGVVLFASVPVLAALLVSFSLRFLVWGERPRKALLAAVSFAAGLAILALIDPLSAAMAVPSCIVVAAMVALMAHRRADTLAVSLVVVAGASAAFLVDSVYAHMLGTTVRELLSGSFAALMQASMGTGIEEGLLLDQATSLFNLFWPFVYVTQALWSVVAAAVASFWLEVRYAPRPMPRVASYDAPLWAVGVLAAGALMVAASFVVASASSWLLSAGVTVIMCARVIFALQGFGVASALMAKTRLGCLGRTVVVFLLFWLETVLMAVSIVGLIDVWANIRKLPRDATPAHGADIQ